MDWISSSSSLLRLKDEPKHSFNQVPLFVSHTLTSDKAQLMSIQFVDQELQRLQVQAAAIQTARMAYAKALQSALPVGDTIKFN